MTKKTKARNLKYFNLAHAVTWRIEDSQETGFDGAITIDFSGDVHVTINFTTKELAQEWVEKVVNRGVETKRILIFDDDAKATYLL